MDLLTDFFATGIIDESAKPKKVKEPKNLRRSKKSSKGSTESELRSGNCDKVRRKRKTSSKLQRKRDIRLAKLCGRSRRKRDAKEKHPTKEKHGEHKYLSEYFYGNTDGNSQGCASKKSQTTKKKKLLCDSSSSESHSSDNHCNTKNYVSKNSQATKEKSKESISLSQSGSSISDSNPQRANKLNLIKMTRDLKGFQLKEAMDLVESAKDFVENGLLAHYCLSISESCSSDNDYRSKNYISEKSQATKEKYGEHNSLSESCNSNTDGNSQSCASKKSQTMKKRRLLCDYSSSESYSSNNHSKAKNYESKNSQATKEKSKESISLSESGSSISDSNSQREIKLNLIKVIRKLKGFQLKEANDLVQSAKDLVENGLLAHCDSSISESCSSDNNYRSKNYISEKSQATKAKCGDHNSLSKSCNSNADGNSQSLASKKSQTMKKKRLLRDSSRSESYSSDNRCNAKNSVSKNSQATKEKSKESISLSESGSSIRDSNSQRANKFKVIREQIYLLRQLKKAKDVIESAKDLVKNRLSAFYDSSISPCSSDNELLLDILIENGLLSRWDSSISESCSSDYDYMSKNYISEKSQATKAKCGDHNSLSKSCNSNADGNSQSFASKKSQTIKKKRLLRDSSISESYSSHNRSNSKNYVSKKPQENKEKSKESISLSQSCSSISDSSSQRANKLNLIEVIRARLKKAKDFLKKSD
ncbi:hypothetical protein QYM36_002174 [Artemia franciscana]|uniref:Uncharacterized protein n=1 Tax=Artemia franciscana TaxID=6661 RepID=A0AA88IN55_ARTSF|nr:hypothetical protein QYM36_002174 [Artemia franciscana]